MACCRCFQVGFHGKKLEKAAVAAVSPLCVCVKKSDSSHSLNVRGGPPNNRKRLLFLNFTPTNASLVTCQPRPTRLHLSWQLPPHPPRCLLPPQVAMRKYTCKCLQAIAYQIHMQMLTGHRFAYRPSLTASTMNASVAIAAARFLWPHLRRSMRIAGGSCLQFVACLLRRLLGRAHDCLPLRSCGTHVTLKTLPMLLMCVR